jgi:hypothetical protein
MKLWIITSALLLSSCTNLHPKTVSDAARDLCEAVFAQRPETIAQAKQQKLSPDEIAKIACAANAVVNPFLLAGRDAGDDAMGQAHKLGIVREPK